MIYVILKNQKVLQYNMADSYCIEANMVTLKRVGSKVTVASFPYDGIERIEFEKPCKIMRAKRPTKTRRNIY